MKISKKEKNYSLSIWGILFVGYYVVKCTQVVSEPRLQVYSVRGHELLRFWVFVFGKRGLEWRVLKNIKMKKRSRRCAKEIEGNEKRTSCSEQNITTTRLTPCF